MQQRTNSEGIRAEVSAKPLTARTNNEGIRAEVSAK